MYIKLNTYTIYVENKTKKVEFRDKNESTDEIYNKVLTCRYGFRYGTTVMYGTIGTRVKTTLPKDYAEFCWFKIRS